MKRGIAAFIAFFTVFVAGVSLALADFQLQTITLHPQDAPLSCNETVTGQMYYVSSTDQVMVCNGTANVPLVTGTNYWSLSGSNLYPSSTGYNVGIGTTAPSQKFDVAGNIALSAGGYIYGDTTNQYVHLKSGDEVAIQYDSNNRLWFGTNGFHFIRGGSEFMTAGYNGNVGINTTAPGTNLDVNGNVQSSIYYDRDNTNYYIDAAANVMPYSALFNGKVGIGTTNPYSSLEILSGSATQGISFFTSSYDASRQYGTRIYTHDDNGGIPLYFDQQSGSTWSTLFRIGSNSADSNKVETFGQTSLATGGGNVGIGTANPTYKLDVSGTMRTVGRTNVQTGNGSIDNYFYASSSVWRVILPSETNSEGYGAGASGFGFYYNTGSKYVLVLKPTGEVSVPTGNLTVSGNISANGATFTQPITVGTPIADNNAATKSYVDSSIAGGSGSSVGYWTLSGSNLYANGTGYNVGIGTTNPGYKLDVSNLSGGVADVGLTSGTSGVSSSNVQRIQLSNWYQGAKTTSEITYDFYGSYYNGGSSSHGLSILSGRPGYSNIWFRDANAGIMGAFVNSGYSQTPSLVTTSNFIIGGRIGVNTVSPGTNLDVNGNVQSSIYYDRDNTNYYIDAAANTMPYSANLAGGVNFNGKLTTPALTTGAQPVYIRGTGLNHSANRLVQIGGTTVVNSTGRGLNLLIITAATQAVVSNTTYDTYGDSVSADNLATALNNLTRDQIGVLTSWDAIEGHITANLQAAARRLGLYKLAGMPLTGSRRPYAAIFYGSGTATANTQPSNQAVEVAQSSDAGAPYALIATWLTQDGFVGQDLSNALASGDPMATSPALFVDSSGNVGIGTTTPATNLHIYQNNGAVNPTSLLLEQAGSGDAGIQFLLTGAQRWEVGADHSDSNKFKIASTGDLSTNAVLTIDTSGNVGIGTTNPSTAGLVVTKNVSSIGIDVNNNRIQNVGTPINANDAATKSYIDSAVLLATSSQYWTLSGGNLYPDSTSYNVGIGTATPQAKLAINYGGSLANLSDALIARGTANLGTTAGSYSYPAEIIAGCGNTCRLQFAGYRSADGSSWGNTAFKIQYAVDNSYTTSSFAYITLGARNAYSPYVSLGTSGSDGLTVDQNGSVGIKTTSPGTTLDVNGNIQSAIYYDRDNTNYYIDAAANVMPYSALFNGSVGIGTTAPSGKVDIYADNILSATAGDLTIEHPTAGGASSIVFPSKTNRGSDYGYVTYSDNNDTYAYWGTSGSERSSLVIGVQNDAQTSNSDVVALKSPAAVIADAPSFLIPSGKVGIGMTAPDVRLNVSNGDVKITNGNLTFTGSGAQITGVSKLTVTSIDPLYSIGGVKYATYVPDVIGYKVEAFGKAQLDSEGSYIIDFNKVERGSDLWLFWQTIAEGDGMKDVSVYLTPQFDGRAWYTIDPAAKQIVIYGEPSEVPPSTEGARGAVSSLEVSYHLVAPRHDTSLWPNVASTTDTGTVLPLKTSR